MSHLRPWFQESSTAHRQIQPSSSARPCWFAVHFILRAESVTFLRFKATRSLPKQVLSGKEFAKGMSYSNPMLNGHNHDQQLTRADRAPRGSLNQSPYAASRKQQIQVQKLELKQ